MPDLKQITLPSGNTYNLVDQGARDLIDALSQVGSWLGITTTALTDGATTNPIVINGESKTAVAGSIAVYENKEFVFNGTAWQEFGDLSVLGALAYKDSVSASYTPAGSVSQPTFEGSQETIRISVTPSGTVSKPTFTGTQKTVTVKGTPEGSVTISKGTGTANYTPEGSVSTPIITVTPNTTTVNSITDVGTLPDLTFTVSDENLTINWSKGTLPTKGSNTTVATGIKSATSSQPTFTGTGAELKGTFIGSELTSSGNFTPTGSVTQPVFTGDEVEGHTSYTPSGTVSKPTFTGTSATITAS